MLERKLWPLRQYEEGTAAAVAWWLSGMPRRIAAKPDAFARDVAPSPEGSVPWETTEVESERSTLENEFGVDPATFQETFLRFGSLGALVRYQTAAHLDAVEELFRLRPRQVGEPAPPPAGSASAGRGNLVLHVFARGPEQLALLRVPSQALVRRPLERMVEIHDGIAHLWVREVGPEAPFSGEGIVARRGLPRAGSRARDAPAAPALVDGGAQQAAGARRALPPARGGGGGGWRHLALRRRQGQRQVDHHARARQGGRDGLLRGPRDAAS